MADNIAGCWALTRERRVFAVTETTYGTMVKPSSSDALRMLAGGGIEARQPNRIERDDNRPTRSLEKLIDGGNPPVGWSYEGYLIPSGTAGTPPDIHALLLAAMGTDTYTNTPATSDAYALTDTAKNLGSLSLHEFYPAGDESAVGGQILHTLTGAFIDTMTISGSGSEPPKISFSGRGSTHSLTTRDTIVDNAALPVVQVNATNNFEPNGIVAIFEAADGTTLVDDNTAAGWKVLSVDDNNDTITLEGSPAGTANTDIVAPWCPTETVTGDPIPGVYGSLVMGGITVEVLAYEITLDNGLQAHDDEAFQSVTTGYHEGKRRVTGQFTYRAKSEDMLLLTTRRFIGTSNATFTLGADAGDICTIVVRAQRQFASMEKSEEDTVICVMPFTGIASASTANELTMTFT